MLLCPLYRLHTLYHTLAKIYLELNLNLSKVAQITLESFIVSFHNVVTNVTLGRGWNS